MTEEQRAAGLPNAAVARAVESVKTFDPGLGSYSFKDLGAVVQFADLMANAGEMLPQHLQGRPALCMAVTMRATHWGFDPFALAMETYQAKQGGPIGYQAKVFTAALANNGVKLRYRYEGEIKMIDKPVMSARGNKIAERTATGDRKCIVYAKVGDEILEYETMTLDQITIKNSPLWHNDPDQQLAYYGGRGWARRYRSDVIMGAYSTDEVEEMSRDMKDVTPEEPKRSAFTQKAQSARKPEPEDAKTIPEEQQDEADERDVGVHWTDEVDTSEAFPGDTVFTEGRNAAKDGAERTDCPHDEDLIDAANWLAGWDSYGTEEEEA